MKALTILIAMLVGGEVIAAGPTPQDLTTKLKDASGKIDQLYVRLAWTGRRMTAGKKVMQETGGTQEVRFDRSAKRMQFKSGKDIQLFDHGKKIMRRKVQGGTRETAYERGIEESTPAVLLYSLYPDYAIGQMQAVDVRENGDTTTLVCYPKDPTPEQRGKARREFDIDAYRGLVRAVRTYSRDGSLANETRLMGIQRCGNAWLPRQVQLLSYAKKGLASVVYTLDTPRTNDLSPNEMEVR